MTWMKKVDHNEWNNLLSKKRDVILNRAKYYYNNDKERLTLLDPGF